MLSQALEDRVSEDCLWASQLPELHMHAVIFYIFLLSVNLIITPKPGRSQCSPTSAACLWNAADSLMPKTSFFSSKPQICSLIFLRKGGYTGGNGTFVGDYFLLFAVLLFFQCHIIFQDHHCIKPIVFLQCHNFATRETDHDLSLNPGQVGLLPKPDQTATRKLCGKKSTFKLGEPLVQ